MYSFIRQRIGENLEETSSSIDFKSGKDVYKSYKCGLASCKPRSVLNRCCSLGSSREHPGGQDIYTSSPASACLQSADSETCGRKPV